MNDRITIVTMFFPIGRGEWNNINRNFQRSDDAYFRFFEFWARIRNDLVVYVCPEDAPKVRRIRDSFGRPNTRIVEIPDYRALDGELYLALKKAAANPVAREFHFHKHNPEAWNAEYVYVMMMKYHCVADAVTRGYTGDGPVAFVDFGHNHGGSYYTDPADFDFEWHYDCDGRMTVFAFRDVLDDTPVFEIVRNMNTYINGGIVIGPGNLWPRFAGILRENLMSIARMGLTDDDQTLLLMACRQYPEMFNVIRCSWGNPIQLCTDHEFSHKKYETVRPSRLRQWLKLQFWRFRTFIHMMRLLRVLRDTRYDY